MTKQLLEIMRFDTPLCPHCGKIDKQLITELLEKEQTACGYCGGTIPLDDPGWRNSLKETADDISAQYKKK